MGTGPRLFSSNHCRFYTAAVAPVAASSSCRFSGARGGAGGGGSLPPSSEGCMQSVGSGIRCSLGDPVDNLEAQALQGEAEAEDDVVRARDPQRAVGLEDAASLAKPADVPFVILLEAPRRANRVTTPGLALPGIFGQRERAARMLVIDHQKVRNTSKLHHRRVPLQCLAGRRCARRTFRAGPGALGCRVPAREGRRGTRRARVAENGPSAVSLLPSLGPTLRRPLEAILAPLTSPVIGTPPTQSSAQAL